MNKNRDDRRVRKTKKALREGLAVLMENKNIKDISVRELTDFVDMHRGTFYLHYRDIYDLQEQIENDIVAEVTEIFENFKPDSPLGDPQPILLALLNYIVDNVPMCRALLGNNANRSFIDKLSIIMQERCLHNWMEQFRLKDNRNDMEYFSRYLVSGYIAIISRWLEGGLQESPQQLAHLMGRIGMHGITFLTQPNPPNESQ